MKALSTEPAEGSGCCLCPHRQKGNVHEFGKGTELQFGEKGWNTGLAQGLMGEGVFSPMPLTFLVWTLPEWEGKSGVSGLGKEVGDDEHRGEREADLPQGLAGAELEAGDVTSFRLCHSPASG